MLQKDRGVGFSLRFREAFQKEVTPQWKVSERHDALFLLLPTYLFTKGITQMAGSIQQQLENSVPGPRVPPRELQ